MHASNNQDTPQVQPHTAILMWSADLSVPHRVATPFMMAQTALALDGEVEVYFTAQTLALLEPRHAHTRIGFGDEALTVQHYLQATTQAGATLWACSQAMHALQLKVCDLNPLVSGAGGLVQFMTRANNPTWRTFVF